MLVLGVICILMWLLAIWMGDDCYREAKTDLPFSKTKECLKKGNFYYTIGIIALLTGIFFIIQI